MLTFKEHEVTIKLIESPAFIVDFRQFVKRDENVSNFQKVQRVVLSPFGLVQCIFIAVAKSAYVTTQYSWTSFKLIVLGYHGSLSNYHPPKDSYLAGLKVVLWAAMNFWCFTTTALRLLINQINPPSNRYLAVFAGKEIDLEHLQSKELAINVSDVPAETTIDNLWGMFNKINFDNKSRLGYMAPNSRKEGDTIYTVEELKKGLETFTNHVKGRIPFLGTPRAYDTPRLMAFYKQIEDAIRFSIHKLDQKLKEFQQTNGTDPASYNEEQQKAYKNILEDRARIAIDMAIAGKHCGARYMGEAMSTYFSFESKEIEGGTLQGSLFEILAQKRSKIAQDQVQKYLGNDTHALSKYMSNLGPLLGLPGTNNVIETLDQSLDFNLFLGRFFAEYTVDAIIETVQAKIQKSGVLREKIIDWLKDQVGDWKKDANAAQEIISKIQPIIDKKVENAAVPPEFEAFQRLITHLQKENITWPSKENWDDFVTELFTLEKAKEWCAQNLPHTNLIQLAKEKNKLKQAFSEETLGPDITKQLKSEILSEKQLDLSSVINRNIEAEKIQEIHKEMRENLSIESETLSRVLNGSASLKEVVENYYNLARRGEFLEKLKLDAIATQGVSSEILEWILVSQKILLPQEIN